MHYVAVSFRDPHKPRWTRVGALLVAQFLSAVRCFQLGIIQEVQIFSLNVSLIHSWST